VLRRSPDAGSPPTLRVVLILITHPEYPDMRSILWFSPGCAAPMLFLVTLTSGEAA
jgi:hypothetical protein